MWQNYINATRIEEVLQVLAEKREKARIIAGATDLMLEMERGVRKGIETLIDISRIPDLDRITLDEFGMIHIGALVTHNHCVGSKLIREQAFPLARAAWEVGSPQIRNRGTIAGNLITASPANDTITPCMALGARVVLRSIRGERQVPLANFYTGVRRTIMESDEMLTEIVFPALKPNQCGTFIKLALRRAQAISLVNIAIVLTQESSKIEKAAITLGSIAPTIIHAIDAEKYLEGKILSVEIVDQVAELTANAAKSIDDLRSSAAYRNKMVEVVAQRALSALMERTEHNGFPVEPVLLRGSNGSNHKMVQSPFSTEPEGAIKTKINGKDYEITGANQKSLLRFIREDIGLTGTKEGCAEGECGACTIYLDGIAVMSCMVPAPRAHRAEITTIEGLSQGEKLHPVQTAFIQEGAVQCGYCTPGFIMSAAKLLEERPSPSVDEIKQAITGNLCRCTGYYKIVQAIEKAAQGD